MNPPGVKSPRPNGEQAAPVETQARTRGGFYGFAAEVDRGRAIHGHLDRAQVGEETQAGRSRAIYSTHRFVPVLE